MSIHFIIRALAHVPTNAACQTIPIKRLLSIMACLFWLLPSVHALAFEFEGPFPTQDYPFEVKASGVEVRVDEATIVEWLDNERVIFSALKPGEPRLQGAKFYRDRKAREAPGRVVVWDTLSGRIEDLGKGKLHCSYRGYISMYWMVLNKQTGKSEAFFKKGFHGSLREYPGWRPGDPPRHQDMHTCQIYEGPRKKPVPDHWVFNLREEDGILDLGPKKLKPGEARPALILIRPDGSRKSLPLTWPRNVDGVWWSDWAGVYFLKQFLSGGFRQPVHPDELPILYPNGKLEMYPLPKNYWHRNRTNRAVITRRGIVVANDAIFSGALFSNKVRSGAYLVRNNQVVRLVPWLVGNERAALDNSHRGIAVSPDGCKLAFKHGEGERNKVAHTIKMINVCERT